MDILVSFLKVMFWVFVFVIWAAFEMLLYLKIETSSKQCFQGKKEEHYRRAV